jgi:hypothetical protein
MSAMRLVTSLCLGTALLLGSATQSLADTKALLGRWNIQSTDAATPGVYWLELTDTNGELSGRFLNRGGSPVKLASVSVTGDDLTFTTGSPNANTPGQTHKASLKDGKLVG